jgi:hypothetical protein
LLLGLQDGTTPLQAAKKNGCVLAVELLETVAAEP